MAVFYVAAGGALGAVARYLVGLWVARILPVAFPLGTLCVNVVGSFLMGLVAAWVAGRVSAPWAAPFLMVGILGGFTTFSAFSLETIALIEQSRAGAALGYVAGSVVFSVAALFAGLMLGRALV